MDPQHIPHTCATKPVEPLDPEPRHAEIECPPASSWPEASSVVDYVTRVFNEVSGIDFAAWHYHLIDSPHAARNRVQWIRLAGIFQAYAPSLDPSDRKSLYSMLSTIPTLGRNLAWHIWHFVEIGTLSYRDIEAAYFDEGPHCDSNDKLVRGTYRPPEPTPRHAKTA